MPSDRQVYFVVQHQGQPGWSWQDAFDIPMVRAYVARAALVLEGEIGVDRRVPGGSQRGLATYEDAQLLVTVIQRQQAADVADSWRIVKRTTEWTVADDVLVEYFSEAAFALDEVDHGH